MMKINNDVFLTGSAIISKTIQPTELEITSLEQALALSAEKKFFFFSIILKFKNKSHILCC